MQDAARRGWAIDDGNYLKGVTTIASGIASAPGAIRYCITSIMFNGQHDAALLTERLAGAVSASGKGAS
jgi:DNA-binding IclR family transcriptional regulator